MQAPKSSYQQLDGIARMVKRELKAIEDYNTIELQVKYGKLKKTFDQKKYQLYKKQSMQNIVLINNQKDAKKHKINAKATQQEYLQTKKNLLGLFKKHQFEIIQKRRIMINFDKQHFQHIIGEQKWFQLEKQKLFQRQIDFILSKKEGRIDMSEKQIESQDCYEYLLKMLHENDNQNIFLRFKQENNYFLSKKYLIVLSVIYQSSTASQINKVYTMLKSSREGFDKFFNQFLDGKIKQKQITRYEIEMRYQIDSLEQMNQMEVSELRQYLGDSLEMFLDLSDNLEEKQLTNLMDGLQIGE